MLHVFTIGLSAFLIFNLQPMISKIILPFFGGGSYVWITCLIFFQTILLAGYAASHFIAKHLNPTKQVAFYTVLIALSLSLIPVQLRFVHSNSPLVTGILLLLFASVGLPYFLLSTTTPTVQYWIAGDQNLGSKNPYVQFAVSNAGSLIGLLGYPFVVEPLFSNSRQMSLWSWGFIFYAVLLTFCLARYALSFRNLKPIAASNPGPSSHGRLFEETSSIKFKWLYQAMIPCAALVVFTNYMTVDIANFPLLWILPLCVYLISFIICFLWPGVSRPGSARSLAVIVPVLVISVMLWGNLRLGLIWKIMVSLVSLFSICIFFHGNLERDKPAAGSLTSFYLYLSMGGCLGGISAGILAPMIFKSIFEFQLVIIVSFYLMVAPHLTSARKNIRIFFQTALCLLIAATYLGQDLIFPPLFIFKARSFYGTYSVLDFPAIPGKHPAYRQLNMGTTNHGGQARDSKNKLFPIAYYHENTGIGKALHKIPNLKNIAFVGLGAGVLALYGKKDQHFDFFEIDPVVVNIAKNHFDNLNASSADIRCIVGDARITLRKMPKNHYDMLALDAFSSGAIPIHLLTVEAITEYLKTLKTDGMLLLHVSNHYLNLLPVLKCSAKTLGLYIMVNENPPMQSSLKLSAKWVVLTKSRHRLSILTRDDPTWRIPAGDEICWTDESSNIWSVFEGLEHR